MSRSTISRRSHTPAILNSKENGFSSSRISRAQPGPSAQQPRGISVAPGNALQRQTYNPSSYTHRYATDVTPISSRHDILSANKYNAQPLSSYATNVPSNASSATTNYGVPSSLPTRASTQQRDPSIGAHSRPSPNMTSAAAHLSSNTYTITADTARYAYLKEMMERTYGVERAGRDLHPHHTIMSPAPPRQVVSTDGIYYQGYQRADSDDEFQSGGKISDVATNNERALAGPQKRLQNLDYSSLSATPAMRTPTDSRSSVSLTNQTKQGTLMPPPSMNRTKQPTNTASPVANYSSIHNIPRQPLQTVTPRAPSSNTTPTSPSLPVSIKESQAQQKDSLTENAEQAPLGFRNLGNTCYLNASMQALLATPGLIEEIENNFGIKEPDSSSNPYSLTNMKSSVSKDMIELARRKEGLGLCLSSLKQRCTERNDVFTGARQNDAHEFLRVLLLLLHENTNRIQGKPVYREMKDRPGESTKDASYRWWQYHLSRDDSVVYDIFGGQQHSIIQCRMCRHESWAFDPFLDLVLSFNKVRCPPISLMLQGYTGLAHLTGADRYYCSRCKKPQDADRQVTITKWPKSLSISLARFDRYGRKNSEEVEIEESIITAPDCSADGRSRRYELYSIVVHTGTTDYGHYYAYVRKGRKWYRCDDSVVRDVPFSIVKQEGRGVYVLFYQKI